MQSMTYLKRICLISNLFIMLSQVVFWKNINFWPICIRPKKRDGFLRHLHDRSKLYIKKKTCESTIKMLAMGPIRFRYVMECIHSEKKNWKNVILKIWQEMWPPSFHLISNQFDCNRLCNKQNGDLSLVNYEYYQELYYQEWKTNFPVSWMQGPWRTLKKLLEDRRDDLPPGQWFLHWEKGATFW